MLAWAWLPIAWAASLRGVGLWDHDRGDQSDASWDAVAASARATLETLVHDVEVEMGKCTAANAGCDEQATKQQAAQLHRYKTALAEFAKVEQSSVVSELKKAQGDRDGLRATVAKLKTVVLGTELGAQSLVRQKQLIEQEQEHMAADRDRATATLSEAEAKLAAAQQDAEDKENAAMLWATEVQSIARAAQLSDQYAEAMYATGVEKFSHAKAKEERAEQLLHRAGTLADKIEGHLSPESIVEHEHQAPSSGGWGSADATTTTTAAPEADKAEEAEQEEPATSLAAAPPRAARSATDARIARWRASAAPAQAKARKAAAPPAGDEEMDGIDQELQELGLDA